MARALVLLSGGLDSAVALWWTLREGHDVVALSFRYRGRPAREVRAARSLAERAGVPLVEADLPFLEEPPSEGRWRAAPRGYIPARNAVFYASAAFHAETLDRDIIVGGHNRDDAARFPDASADFFARFEEILRLGLWHADRRAEAHARPSPAPGPGAAPTVAPARAPAPALALRLLMPLLARSKLDVVALGRELGVPMALAWSCYEDGEAPCGACPSCLERRTVAAAEAAAQAAAP